MVQNPGCADRGLARELRAPALPGEPGDRSVRGAVRGGDVDLAGAQPAGGRDAGAAGDDRCHRRRRG